MSQSLLNKKGLGGQRLNFHIIFSDEVSVENLEPFIKNLKVNKQSIAERYADCKFLQEDVPVDLPEFAISWRLMRRSRASSRRGRLVKLKCISDGMFPAAPAGFFVDAKR